MTREVLTVREWEELGLSSDLIRFRRFRHLPVVDARGRLVGILSRTDLLGLAGRREGSRLLPTYEAMQKNPVTIGPGASIEEAAALMRDHRIHSLPVVDEAGNLEGILTDTDLLGAISKAAMPARNLGAVRVAEVMTPDPTTVELDADIEDAAGKLLEGGFRHLPVVDADGRLTGMISERDVRSALGTDLVDWGSMDMQRLEEVIGNVMVPEPTIVRATNRLIDILDVFTDERIGAVPVLDQDDTLVGILSYVDVLSWLRDQAERSGIEPGAPAEVFEATPAP